VHIILYWGGRGMWLPGLLDMECPALIFNAGRDRPVSRVPPTARRYRVKAHVTQWREWGKVRARTRGEGRLPFAREDS